MGGDDEQQFGLFGYPRRDEIEKTASTGTGTIETGK